MQVRLKRIEKFSPKVLWSSGNAPMKGLKKLPSCFFLQKYLNFFLDFFSNNIFFAKTFVVKEPLRLWHCNVLFKCDKSKFWHKSRPLLNGSNSSISVNLKKKIISRKKIKKEVIAKTSVKTKSMWTI